jgi:hypothetical protein
VLALLRTLTPPRPHITYGEALRIAELQATRLTGLLALAAGEGITEHHIAGLPRVGVTYEHLPVSGTSHWNGHRWIIALARSDSPARQRFTLLHEFKHILDHGHTARLYHGDRHLSPHEQAELVADYFAGCALVPKRLLKAAWGNGIQRPSALADHFNVSEHAIRVRLAQTGLSRVADDTPTPRCARPVTRPTSPGQYFRIATPPSRYQRTWA